MVSFSLLVVGKLANLNQYTVRAHQPQTTRYMYVSYTLNESDNEALGRARQSQRTSHAIGHAREQHMHVKSWKNHHTTNIAVRDNRK